MGITYIEGTVRGPTGQARLVNFLVDSGAAYSLLPVDVWQAIGLAPRRSMTFMLADGTPIQRQISECEMALAGQEGHSPVVLGEPGDVALLGAITLENFALVLDPFQRTLRPMHLRLA